MQITNFVESRRQGGSRHNFCSTWFSAYLVSSIGTLQWCRYRYSGTSIGTPFEINLLSILEKAYRYPSSLMELEYRYWLPSTGTGSLETIFGALGSMFHCVLVPKFVMCDSLNLDDVLPRVLMRKDEASLLKLGKSSELSLRHSTTQSMPRGTLLFK
ncbi:hypothetical protein GQ457_06G016510 [Hibiscus cannabinus]